MTEPGSNSAQALASYIERVERLNEEIKALQNDRKEVYAEAKRAGFDVPAMKDVVRVREMERPDRENRIRTIETYLRALGDFADMPLGEAAIRRMEVALGKA